MPHDYDVVIVGGRCAGASLAVRLARAGVRVCMLDQARFPSDTASTHVIQPSGVKLLTELGVRDAVFAVAPPIERALVAIDDARIELDDSTGRLGAPALNIRRVTLDQILLDAARAAGAEVRTQARVAGVRRDSGRVCGVSTSAGDITARYVVGADGVGSTVAAAVGAQEYCRVPVGRAFVWAYLDAPQAPRDQLWFGKTGTIGYLASPTDAGLFLTAVGFPVAMRDRLRTTRQEAFTEAVAQWPELDRALAGATRRGPLRAVLDWHGYFRTASGPGWALVGDAGHFKDPTPGQGISDALRQTTTLADAIVSGLAGTDPDGPLRTWWEWRDRDAWDMYWFAADLGAPGPTPAVIRAVLRRVAQDEAMTMRLFRIFDHDLPSSKLAGPRDLLAAVGAALRERDTRRRDVFAELLAIVRDGASRSRAWRRRPTPGRAATPVAATTPEPSRTSTAAA